MQNANLTLVFAASFLLSGTACRRRSSHASVLTKGQKPCFRPCWRHSRSMKAACVSMPASAGILADRDITRERLEAGPEVRMTLVHLGDREHAPVAILVPIGIATPNFVAVGVRITAIIRDTVRFRRCLVIAARLYHGLATQGRHDLALGLGSTGSSAWAICFA
jgi:hypothetical protein